MILVLSVLLSSLKMKNSEYAIITELNSSILSFNLWQTAQLRRVRLANVKYFCQKIGNISMNNYNITHSLGKNVD